MEQVNNVQQIYTEKTGLYHNVFDTILRYKYGIEAFHKKQDYIRPNMKILDAGCGYGKWLIYLNNIGYDVIGIDNNKLAISKLKEYNRKLQVTEGNLLKLPFPTNHFDAYISMGVIEHFERGPIPALEEAYRVLKPNGFLFVSTPTINFIRKLIIKNSRSKP